MPVTANLSRAQIVSLLGNDPIDNNFGIGSVIVGRYAGVLASGATTAGSSINRLSFYDPSWGVTLGTVMAGTWRNIGGSCDAIGTFITTFQRIA